MIRAARLWRPSRRTWRLVALAPIIIAPHLLAGASAELSAVIAIMLAFSATITLLTVEHAAVPAGARELTALFTALIALSILQALPLPCAFVDALLGAGRTEIPRAVARLTGEPPYCSLSVDPGLTATSIMQGATCLVAFLVCALHSAAGHRRDVIRVVALAGTSVALSALLHLAYDADRVYGLYLPSVDGAKPFGPIINVNQLAGLCALTMPAMIAVALDRSDRRAAASWLGAAALTLVVALMTLSRGGIGAIAIAVLLVLAIIGVRKQVPSSFAVVASAVLVSSGIAAWFLLGNSIVGEFLVGGHSKISLIAAGMNHAIRQGVLGHGRGAFGIAAIDVSGTGDWLHFAESMPVQWIGDYGVLLGPIAVVFLGATALYTAATSERVPQRLVAAGLVAFGLQNFVDFGLEMTGIAVVASAALAAAVTKGGRRSELASRTWLGRGYVASAAVLALSLAATRAGTSVERDLAVLRESLTASDFAAFDERLGATLSVHPRNPAIALYGAAAARARGADTTVAWLNIAMRGAPAWWSPHREAALFLLARGRGLQATYETRIVAEIHRGHGTALLCELARHGVPTRILVRAAPRRRPGSFLAESVACMPAAVAAELDANLLTWRVPPSATLVRALEAARARGDATTVRHLVRRAEAAHPRSAPLALSAARALCTIGDHHDAFEAIARARSLHAPEGELALAEATVYVSTHDLPHMRRALTRLRESANGDLDALASAEATTARLELESGNASEAIRALERAYQVSGQVEHLASILQITTTEGWEARAIVARRQLCVADPDHVGCDAAH